MAVDRKSIDFHSDHHDHGKKRFNQGQWSHRMAQPAYEVMQSQSRSLGVFTH
jgi:hypothetical protein